MAAKHASEIAFESTFNQRFHYDAKTGLISGWDGRVLDIFGGSKEIGTKVAYGPSKNGPHQQWDYVNGEFKTRMGTGFVIDTWGGPDAVKEGAQLKMGPSKNMNHQKWDIDAHGFIRSRHNHHFVVDVVGAKPAETSNVMSDICLWKAKATDHQLHEYAKLKGAFNQRFRYDAGSGLIYGWDGRVLDVFGGSKDIGAKVAYGPSKNGDHQKWDYVNGEFKTRMGTGFVIDTWGGPDAVKDGAQLKMGPSKNMNHQKWDIDAYGFIRSRHNGKFVIDVVGAKPAEVSNVMSDICLWTCKF
jgi:hypothetical protein